MPKRYIGLLALSVLFFSPTTALAAPVKVVATFSMVGDLVKNVGQDRVELTVLVGANGDVHAFEPTPQDGIILSKADIIFENGLHLEHWLDDLYASSASKARRIVVSDDVETLKAQGDVDPHIWHDVNNALIMVENIRKGFGEVDPTHADYYEHNAQVYIEQLARLNYWVMEQLKDIPDENRKLVTGHDTFAYFAARYGFQIVGAAIESATTEAVDPSAAQIAALMDKIKSAKVKAVFTENMHNPKLLQSLAQEAGVKVAPDLYTDALGPAGSDGDTYIKMIQHNVQIIAEYLK